MPIYEYQCLSCGHKLEALQDVKEAPLSVCPECHKSMLNKLVSASGFQLKGTGWYATDYSKKGKAKGESEKSEKSETNSSNQSSTSPSSTSDTKTGSSSTGSSS